MAREHESRILQLTEANLKLRSELLSKDKLISKFESELKSAAPSEHQMVKVELSAEPVPVVCITRAGRPQVDKLTEISAKLSKMNEQFERRMSYINNQEFHIKTSVIKKAIAMARAKIEAERADRLSSELVRKVGELDHLKDEIFKLQSTQKDTDPEVIQKYIQEIQLLDLNNEKIEKQKNDFKQKYLNASAEGKQIRLQFQESQNTIVQLTDEISDLKTDNQNCLNKINKLNEGESQDFLYLEISSLK